MAADRPRRRLSVAVAGMILFGGGAARATVPDRPARIAPATPEETVAAATLKARGGDCPGALALLDPLVGVSPADGAVRVAAQLLRMPCLASTGRGDEVAPVLAELKRAAPDNPLVQGYAVFADTDAGRYAEAADGLAGLAAARSRALALIPGELWRTLAQKLTIARDFTRRNRTALALALAEWQPRDHPEIAEQLVSDGIGTLLDGKDVEGARALLPRVRRPEALWDMAIERRFVALWPDIEARLGPASGIAIDRFGRDSLAAYADDPSDDHVLRDAVRAFLLLGRTEDVTATAAPVTITAGMGEDRVDIVLADAQARAAGGDLPGAVARLRPFATLDLARTPEAAGALIALAEMLDESRRYDEELMLARDGLGAKTDYYSPFGRAWLRRSETCALSALHRDAEARTSGDALKAVTVDNDAAVVEGLLCAGREREAAAIAVAALASAEGADRLADQFQPEGAVFASSPSRLRGLWSRLLVRGEVKAAFEKAARLLPRSLWPSKAPRAVPVLAGGGATT